MGCFSTLHEPRMRVVEQPERHQSEQLEIGVKIVEIMRAYPVWTEFCKQKMLNPVHVIFWSTMLN